jgi:hypothetical protein
MARNGPAAPVSRCPLMGVERPYFKGGTSVFDPLAEVEAYNPSA